MDTLPILALASTAVGGAVVGAAACYFPLQRAIGQLRERLERSEQARNGAVERSAQAREQIAQLNRAITDLRRAHSARGTASGEAGEAAAPTAQQRAEQALAAGDEKTVVLPRREAPQAFADTQVMAG